MMGLGKGEVEGMSAEAQSGSSRFRAVLTPNRSLSRQGFVVLMAAVGLVNLVMGIVFLVLGAWPVFVFCGLDVLLVYVAFRLNYRSGQTRETIEIAPPTVVLTRIDARGQCEVISLDSYWARVRLSEHPSGATELRLGSRGREHAIARFLSDGERRELAAVLAQELQLARTPGAG
jgi:uncharacterized membrane protein